MSRTTKAISSKANKPVATIFLIAVSGIGTIISLVGGLSILWPGTFLDSFWKLNPTARSLFVTSVGQASGMLLLCLGGLSLITGLGLWKGYKWSWWLALFLLLIVACVNITRFITGDPGEFFGTPLTLYLLWLHTRQTVRNYFGVHFHRFTF